MTLTQSQAAARFGMTLAEAHQVRDKAAAVCTGADAAKARAAWSGMADVCRASAHHPELIRFKFLQSLADGQPIDQAAKAARQFAQGE